MPSFKTSPPTTSHKNCLALKIDPRDAALFQDSSWFSVSIHPLSLVRTTVELILLVFQIFCIVFTIFVTVAILQIFAEESRRTQTLRFFVKFSEKLIGVSQKFKGYSKIMIFQSNLRKLLNFRRNSVQNLCHTGFRSQEIGPPPKELAARTMVSERR